MIRFLLPLIVSTIPFVEAQAAPNAEAESGQTPHERLLALLLEDDGVLAPALDIHPVTGMYNREAIIPPQCYTRHEQRFNPCYVCHQAKIPGRENVMNDDDLQAEYSFSDLGMANHWKNLFEDRSERVAAVTDEEILRYVSEENYSELAGRLREVDFQGWIPDLKNLEEGADAFDEFGWAKDGSGWVAFNYKPLPSTFWPTNGSTDDVMIRLPEIFRQDSSGNDSRDVYRANLAILEAVVKGATAMSCLPVDERICERDLNEDGQFGVVTEVTDLRRYVGRASGEPIDQFLYPTGTEFLHTVRYLGIAADGGIVPSRRMKEVRYMKKWRAFPKVVYARNYQLEGFEKEAGNLPGYHNLRARGLDNGSGWSVSGFIENRQGRLRTYTYEENFSCMGCHNSIGSTIDKTFSFPRKKEGKAGWGYIDLKKMSDVPNQGETVGEIATYLRRVGGGSEFRNNDEMLGKWFTEGGRLSHAKLSEAKSVYDLIVPSKQRALTLNKAYYVIVQDQDFIYGKDATVKPPTNVFDRIDNETATLLPENRRFRWSILLDWSDHGE